MVHASEQSVWIRVFSLAADILMTVISFVAAFALRSQIRTVYFFGTALSLESYYNILIIIVITWWFLLDTQKAYSAQRRISLTESFGLIVRTALIGTVGVFIIAYVLRLELPPRSTIGLFVIINISLLYLNRLFFYYLLEYLRTEGSLRKKILIIGSGEKAQRFLARIRENAEWSADLIGFIDLNKELIGTEIMGARIIGTAEDLLTVLHQHPVDEVVFAVPTKQVDQCTDMLALCEQEGVRAVILSDFFSGLVARATTEIQYDQPVLIYSTALRNEWQLLLKRVFDIMVSGTFLLLFMPLMAIIALVIKLQDGGPVFYKWKVVGLNKEKFTGHKFRTMVVDADKMKKDLIDKNEMKSVAFKMKDDPRITKIGRILRRYSLDEMPQLWSVFKGDMSIVGPRPPLESELPRFESWHRRKLSVKPGLTCLWQISGRSTITDFDEWMKLDLAYIDNWSLLLDLKILLKTVPAVLAGRGAH